jgi:hypothetical protein
LAGFSYVPLLVLYAFGLFSNRKVQDLYAIVVSILAPIISMIVYFNIEKWIGYKMGFEILLINGGLTFWGLKIFSSK